MPEACKISEKVPFANLVMYVPWYWLGTTKPKDAQSSQKMFPISSTKSKRSNSIVIIAMSFDLSQTLLGLMYVFCHTARDAS